MAAEEVLEEGHRLRRREFLIAGAGAGLALASPLNYGALARARMVPRGQGRRVRLRRRLGHPVSGGDHLVDAAQGNRPHLEASRRGCHRLKLPSRRQAPRRSRPGRPRISPSTRASAASSPRDAVPLPLRDRGRGVPHGAPSARFRRPDSNETAARSASTRARATRPGTTRRMPRSQRRRTSISSSASATTSTSTTTTTGRLARVDTTGANKDGDVQTPGRVPAEVPLLPVRQEPPGPARGVSVRRHLGRPRGRGQLRRHAARLGVDRSRATWRTTTSTRGGCRSASAARTATRRSTRRCRGSAEGKPDQLYGSMRLGNMAELFLTDERQYRDQQPCNDVQVQACPDDLHPGRTFLGATAEDAG